MDISQVQAAIARVEKQIEEICEKLVNPTKRLPHETEEYLRVKENNLRAEKNNLCAKENSLLVRENQLHEEKLLMLRKHGLPPGYLGPTEYPIFEVPLPPDVTIPDDYAEKSVHGSDMKSTCRQFLCQKVFPSNEWKLPEKYQAAPPGQDDFDKLDFSPFLIKDMHNDVHYDVPVVLVDSQKRRMTVTGRPDRVIYTAKWYYPYDKVKAIVKIQSGDKSYEAAEVQLQSYLFATVLRHGLRILYGILVYKTGANKDLCRFYKCFRSPEGGGLMESNGTVHVSQAPSVLRDLE